MILGESASRINWMICWRVMIGRKNKSRLINSHLRKIRIKSNIDSAWINWNNWLYTSIVAVSSSISNSGVFNHIDKKINKSTDFLFEKEVKFVLIQSEQATWRQKKGKLRSISTNFFWMIFFLIYLTFMLTRLTPHFGSEKIMNKKPNLQLEVQSKFPSRPGNKLSIVLNRQCHHSS